jgi:hypothetical protein
MALENADVSDESEAKEKGAERLMIALSTASCRDIKPGRGAY